MADTDTERLTRRIAALETAVLELIKIHNERSIQRLSRFEAADLSRDITSARDGSGEDPA